MSEKRIHADVAALCESGSRMVGTRGHDGAVTYLTKRLGEIGSVEPVAGSFAIPFEGPDISGVNLVARLPGTDPKLSPVLVGAHYDTCGEQPGADDNAAGVAVVLRAAAVLAEKKLRRTVLFAFFDSEEPPYFQTENMGSVRFFEDQLPDPVHCAIILELVGHDVPVPGLEDFLFITGMESDQGLEKAVKESDPDQGLKVIPTLNEYVGDLSDHFVFRSNRRPYMLLTCGRWDHYHADTDTPDRLNYGKIDRISQYVCDLVERVSHTALDGPFEGYDSTRTELLFLNQNLLPLIQSVGLNVKLSSRSDIDYLVSLLVQRFGL